MQIKPSIRSPESFRFQRKKTNKIVDQELKNLSYSNGKKQIRKDILNADKAVDQDTRIFQIKSSIRTQESFRFQRKKTNKKDMTASFCVIGPILSSTQIKPSIRTQ
ncbi:uncharacterized protein LOC144714191 [Wolffia australiana]